MIKNSSAIILIILSVSIHENFIVKLSKNKLENYISYSLILLIHSLISNSEIYDLGFYTWHSYCYRQIKKSKPVSLRLGICYALKSSLITKTDHRLILRDKNKDLIILTVALFVWISSRLFTWFHLHWLIFVATA